MLTCKQMTDLVTDFEERRMPWIDRARFHLHLLTCRHCREYLAQMRLTVATLARLPRESRQGEIVTLCQGCSLRHPPFPRRAAFVSLAVGSCLTLINQGDSLLAAQLTPALAWKIPLTYAVPFFVSWLSSVATARSMAAVSRDGGSAPHANQL